MLKEKSRPQHNEMKLSLQYPKLHRKDNESTKNDGQTAYKTIECNYKKHDRRPKEQFINSINNEEMTQEIMKKLTDQKNTQEIDIEQVLM